MLIGILDCETTGVAVETSAVIEVAIATYDTRAGAVRTMYSSLIQHDGNEAEAVNGISPSMLVDAPAPGAIWASVQKLTAHATPLLAWNSDFDRSFCPSPLKERPFVDAMEFSWPRATESRSLIAVALAHGVGVSHAHRAMADVDLLARLLTRAKELGADLDAMIAMGLRPRALFEVADKWFDEGRNAQAKAAGFKWIAEAKSWRRSMAVEDAAALPFKVVEVAA